VRKKLLLLTLLTCLILCSIAPAQDSKYLNTVRQFADNVIKYGRDTYGPKHTPLFVDALNIHTHEPVKWIDLDGETYIIRDLHRVVTAKCRLWSLLNRPDSGFPLVLSATGG